MGDAGRSWWLWEWLFEEVLRVADGSWKIGYESGVYVVSAMSEEQLSAFLAALKADAGLQENLKDAGDLDAVVAIAQEAGFDVRKADWLRYQAKQTLELSDEELESVAGGLDSGTVPGCPPSWACGPSHPKAPAHVNRYCQNQSTVDYC